MAACDYRSCDVCGCKAFYDANLNYCDRGGMSAPKAPFRVAGGPQYGSATEEQNRDWSSYLDNLGDWAVICVDCSKTHRTVVEVIDAP